MPAISHPLDSRWSTSRKLCRAAGRSLAWHGLGLLTLCLATGPAVADDAVHGNTSLEVADAHALAADPFGAPIRVRDYTFPTYLLLSFAPQPATPLTRGEWAVEANYAQINNFQVSRTVEAYLEAERGGQRRSLDQADADFILGLPQGEGFYIDGEFQFLDFVTHYGVTDRLDVGLAISYIDFSGGLFDGTIFDFHETFGYGQQGRNFVVDDQFQIVLGQDGQGLTLLDGPPSGGFSDPSLFVRYFLGQSGRWSFNLAGGVKIPIADEEFLSSGELDYGMLVTAQASWRRHALVMNLSVVEPGEFESQGVDPPLLPSLNVSWMRAFGDDRNYRFLVQVLTAEHAFSDLVDSELAELEVQVTLGLKRATKLGVFGVGITENLFAYDNTPDIGVHLSWAHLSN